MNDRDKLWYLVHDRGGELAELDLQLDLIDAAIADEHHLQFEATKQQLERIGYDTSKLTPPPRPRHYEQRTARHVRHGDDVEALILDAQESALDRVYREHLQTRASEGGPT
jgi:hypothetical protein